MRAFLIKRIMNLDSFFRLVTVSIFQKQTNVDYDKCYFYCPKIICNDGFNVSLQINSGNYCTSENGYRKIGLEWKEVEFGFPSENEETMKKHAEGYGYESYDEDGKEIPFNESEFNITNAVGRIPVSVMEEVCAKHGGVNWDETLSLKNVSHIFF